MARFYATIQGNRSPATRMGHQSIKAAAQSYDGSVITELSYNEEDKLMVDVCVSEGSSSTYGNRIFYGTFDEYVAKLRA